MKSNRQRQEEFRQRKLNAGLSEVRGIFATPEDAKQIKDFAQYLTSISERDKHEES